MVFPLLFKRLKTYSQRNLVKAKLLTEMSNMAVMERMMMSQKM